MEQVGQSLSNVVHLVALRYWDLTTIGDVPHAAQNTNGYVRQFGAF